MKNEIIKKLIQKYEKIHPLIIKRTFEYTKSFEESIYILENIPSYPIMWSKAKKKWINQNAPIN